MRCSFHAEGRGSVMPVLSPVLGWHGPVSVDLSSVWSRCGSECGFCRNYEALAATGTGCFRLSRIKRARTEARVRACTKETI